MANYTDVIMFRAFRGDRHRRQGEFAQIEVNGRLVWTVSDGNGLAYHYGAGTYDNWTNSLDSWSQSSSGMNSGSGLNDGSGLNEPSLSTWQ